MGNVKKLLKTIRGIYKGRGYEKFGKTSNVIAPMRIIGKNRISIGENVFILNGLRMEAIDLWQGQTFSPSIEIGDRVSINQNCHITCANSIKIGTGVSILPDVLITDIEHNYERGKSISETGITVGSVEIGDFVTIGMGARILGHRKITIGNNAVIGTNTVIIKSVPDDVIVAGNPARVISRYCSDKKIWERTK